MKLKQLPSLPRPESGQGSTIHLVRWGLFLVHMLCKCLWCHIYTMCDIHTMPTMSMVSHNVCDNSHDGPIVTKNVTSQALCDIMHCDITDDVWQHRLVCHCRNLQSIGYTTLFDTTTQCIHHTTWSLRLHSKDRCLWLSTLFCWFGTSLTLPLPGTSPLTEQFRHL